MLMWEGEGLGEGGVIVFAGGEFSLDEMTAQCRYVNKGNVRCERQCADTLSVSS